MQQIAATKFCRSDNDFHMSHEAICCSNLSRRRVAAICRIVCLGLKGPGKRGHIVADTMLPTQMFPRLPARATFVADTNFVSGTQKMFLIFSVQKHFVSATNVSRFAQPKKHHGQQCIRNNVSSFARALSCIRYEKS